MQVLVDLITNNIGIIISTLFGSGSLLAYILERKKRANEDNEGEASALQKMQEAYDKFTKDSLERYTDLSAEILKLRQEVFDLTKKLTEEQDKYNVLKSSYEKLKNSYDNLKRNFDDYKKNNTKKA